MSLQNLQVEFADSIFDGAPIDGVHPVDNFAIYRNNVISNLSNVLTEVYPLIEKLLGSDFFQLTIKEYIHRYPSCSGNLHDYGEYFSDFLAEYQPLKDLPYLAEVAQFEWFCQQLFFAANPAAFDVSFLENVSEEQYPHLHFQLHPASRVHKFHYPILRIIELCDGDIDEDIHMNEGSVYLLLIRRELDVLYLPLTIGEFTFLSALQENQSLAVAADAALEADPNFDLEEALPRFITDITIVDGYLKPL